MIGDRTLPTVLALISAHLCRSSCLYPGYREDNAEHPFLSFSEVGLGEC
jgi:hypothetical protein